MPNCLNFTGTPTQYVPADLRHDTNGWYIVYYEFNPIADGLERKRVRLNQLRKRCRTALEFRVQATDIMRTINQQILTSLQVMASLQKQPIILQEQPQAVVPMTTAPSVAPAVEIPSAAEAQEIIKRSSLSHNNSRQFRTLEDVIDIYLTDKKDSTRATTYRSYHSVCTMFKRWVAATYSGIKVCQFGKQQAVEFLESVEKRDGISNRTYNNNLKIICAFFTWAIKKCYANENPFMGQQTKRVTSKQREILTQEAIQLSYNWFMENKPAMCLIMRLVYTSLLRPVEISRVQVNQIDFENHCIHMPGDKTKNYYERDARMDADLEAMLRTHIQGAKPTDYLFADRQWTCGKRSQTSHSYSKAWEDMRAHLVDKNGNRLLPESYQLYSLKDTSMTGMLLQGIPNISVMKAAGHRRLDQTFIYTSHKDPTLNERLNEEAPKFGSSPLSNRHMVSKRLKPTISQ